jgi:uroporphyrinogen decarboxylase
VSRTMTPRQRVRAALNHQPSDRVPIEYHTLGTPEMIAKLKAHLGLQTDDQLLERLGVDIRRIVPRYVGPPLRRWANGRYEDFWGVIREPVSHGSGTYSEIVGYPLADVQAPEDLDGYRWPKVEWFDFAGLREQIERIREREEYAIELGNGRIFEASWFMLGWERILLDAVANPELVSALVGRVNDFFVAYFTAALSETKGLVDIGFTSDDVAMQHGPLMALDTWRTLLKPEHARLNRVLHSFGVKIIYHSCGAVMDFLEDFAEMGIDCLEPLQFSAKGMDPRAMKARIGDRLCFHGGVDVQTVLPFGSPSDVRARTQELIDVLGEGGGYILGPSHSIQEDTPVENALALFDTALGR